NHRFEWGVVDLIKSKRGCLKSKFGGHSENEVLVLKPRRFDDKAPSQTLAPKGEGRNSSPVGEVRRGPM
ncbi:MAG: hypothetical protein KDC92_03850, partial [Bacteroidetes bacterium]|nr:hypothetical protein [Bacteroidota bacterium]